MKWLGLTKEEPAGTAAAPADSSSDTSTETDTDEEQGTATEETIGVDVPAAEDNTAAAAGADRWTRFKKCLRRY
jgi:hypothetical protein